VKTPYELWKGRLKTMKHFRVFRSKCYIKREIEILENLTPKLTKEYFSGYSSKRNEGRRRGFERRSRISRRGRRRETRRR
jgi:hypothetical protein